MRDALMTERSGPACIILRRVKSGRLVKSPFRPSHKPPRFGVPEEIRTPDPTLRSTAYHFVNCSYHIFPCCFFENCAAWRQVNLHKFP